MTDDATQELSAGSTDVFDALKAIVATVRKLVNDPKAGKTYKHEQLCFVLDRNAAALDKFDYAVGLTLDTERADRIAELEAQVADLSCYRDEVLEAGDVHRKFSEMRVRRGVEKYRSRRKDPVCPVCAGALRRVTQHSDSMLNSDQFDAIRAGDWYCTACPDATTSSGFTYFWERSLPPLPKDAAKPELTPDELDDREAAIAKYASELAPEQRGDAIRALVKGSFRES